MKKIILLIFLSFNYILNAQFKVSGKIDNYASQDLMVRIYTGPSDKLINKFKTDKDGKFTVKIPVKYSGIVKIENYAHSLIEILSDNEDVEFTANYENQNFSSLNITKGKTAKGFEEYKNFESFNDLKLNVFPMIKSLYNPSDEFYKAVQEEEARIDEMNPVTDLPLLKYYIQTNDLANTEVDAKPAAEIHKNKILNKLMTDNNDLEGTGLMSKLVLDYLRYSIMGATSQEQINGIVEQEVDTLLEKTDLETPRGQNVLSSVFLVLPEEQFGTMLEKYYAKANALTCEITDELKSTLTAHNDISPGKVVPNIVFKNPVKGYKSLYDIKADKKIIIFWASWCPACQDELPFVKEYYNNFKQSGGEIVGISLDFDKTAFEEATKDLGWINYTELMQWDTPEVVDYGVTSTPTLFLVDKDNKLIKKSSHISDLVEM